MQTSKSFRLVCSLLTLLVFSSCMRPPNNDFKPHHRAVGGAIGGTVLGGAITELTHSSVGAGMGLGAVAGFLAGSYLDSRQGLSYLLSRKDIQVIQYGDIVTMWIPTDALYDTNTYRLNEVEYRTLNNIVKYVKTYPDAVVHVAGFSDDVGGLEEQFDISTHRAQMMMAYLWAHGVALSRLDSVGYDNHFILADNAYVDGSALNRRVELQWRSPSTIL